MKQRPLSPHIQIYKIQMTSLLSILHRGTGLVLFGGAFLWALWFVCLATSETTYGLFQSWVMSPLGMIILLGWSFSFFYHFCNGIRHLCWDMGYGFDMPMVRFTGWVTIISSIMLAFASWIFGFFWAGFWL